MKCIISLLLFFFLLPAKAETWLQLGGLSKHLSNQEYRETHPGLGIVHRTGDNSFVVAGTYRNSINNQTIYAGYWWRPAACGVLLGAATGYDYPVIPVLIPTCSLEGKTIAVDAMFIPPVRNDIPATLAIMFRIRFN